jgi:integrase
MREAAAKGRPLTEEITDSHKRKRTRELQPLSPQAINMTVTLLAAILEGAVERELIGRNPAKGKRRRVAERKPARSYLAGRAQIESLLDAAGEIDAEATRERSHLLRDELLAVRSRRQIDQDAYVFPTHTGRRQYEAKVRTATLGSVVRRANERLVNRGLQPLPAGLTPHSLRRTFATVLYALGESPAIVKAEMGHETAALALELYAQAELLSLQERTELAAFMAGSESGGEVVSIRARRASNWQTSGRRGQNDPVNVSEGSPA